MLLWIENEGESNLIMQGSFPSLIIICRRWFCGAVEHYWDCYVVCNRAASRRVSQYAYTFLHERSAEGSELKYTHNRETNGLGYVSYVMRYVVDNTIRHIGKDAENSIYYYCEIRSGDYEGEM